MNLSALIRKYRKERRLTLKTVAERAGVSEGFLSQVENAVSSPSVDTLIHICDAIGIQAGDLVNQINRQEKLVLVRRAEWDDVDLPHTGFVTKRFFSPENRRAMDSAILVLEPEKSIPARQGVRNAQEVLCVLKGSLELNYGDRTILLNEGDSIHYWSMQERQNITNRGESRAIALWVGTL
jgi:transcriptional regulator with XRE-family HTH domain